MASEQPVTPQRACVGEGARVLFLSYNGMTSRIGQAQVLPYLIGLAERGSRILIASSESSEELRTHGQRIRAELERHGITWRPRVYSSLPGVLGKLQDRIAMLGAAVSAARHWRPGIVHCRSYMPADSALLVKRLFGAKFVFDMRGFWPDQRLEGNRWPQQRIAYRLLYKLWKWKEARYIARADAIVVLAQAARRVVSSWPAYRGAPVAVIPCCIDFDGFKPSGDQERNELRTQFGVTDGRPVAAYLGSLGSVYLLDDMLACFAAIKASAGSAHLRLIGSHPAKGLLERAQALGLPIDEGDVSSSGALDRPDIPAQLSACDVGLCFITPTFSSAGVSPTKLGEYLACGLPVICNDGIGDVTQIVEDTGAGVVVRGSVEREVARNRDVLAPALQGRRMAIRDRSKPLLDMEGAIAAYEDLYACLR